MAHDLSIFGYFTGRDTDFVSISGQTFMVIKVFEFSSETKCMSIVVRNLATRKVYVFVKGADSTVIEMSKQNL
jgi:magnesium-transporting ATPase (P-type)